MSHPRTLDEGSLLLTLEESSRLVSHSHDPHETLTNIVRLIRDRFQTAVCSVYLFEPGRRELVLGATVGLKADSVGRVRMKFDEGLTGLVAEKMAPVMVEDAFQHPRFKYFPEIGEDPYHSFAGIPLIEAGVVQGVLVVQAVEPRRFSTSETRVLVTVASQLAPLVSGARLLERVAAVSHAPAEPATKDRPAPLRGTGLSPGVGWGAAYLVNRTEERPLASVPGKADLARERQRLAQSVEAAREETTRQSQRLSSLAG